jgi:hypothetical protein
MRRSLAIATFAALGAIVAPGARDAAHADGPGDQRDPTVGYLYPAGGRSGTVFQLMAGGQNLNGVTGAIVSGDGVRAVVLRHVRPLNNMQQQELRRRIAEVREQRRAAADEAGQRKRGGREARARDPAKKAAETAPKEERAQLPDHPLLNALDTLSDEALEQVAARFLGVRGKQANAQIAETVEVEVEIAPGLPPGPRELRFETPLGLTNPLRFEVGAVAETTEEESAVRGAQNGPALDVPVLVNGQILPGDADRFRFRARRGQRLVVEAHARTLVPFLADAVPGWFQATLAVLDVRGRELAYSDDAGFEPDPRLAFDVAADGEYLLEIRDALWRGREDFVYRVSVTEDPTLGRTPSARDAAAAEPSPAEGAAPACDEAEPNDAAAKAQPLNAPCIVRGRIARPGDVDCYSFRGLAGDEVVAEVEGRRLGSPVDSGLRLLDAAGNVVAWNDDFEDGEPGTITHHADSYLRTRLPSDGTFVLRVVDVQGHGDADHTYRLRVGPPQPDFQLVVTPSSLTLPAGRSIPFRVHAVRRDGFDGPIDLSLVGAPPGFVLSGARIPSGRASVRMTLAAPRGGADGPIPLRFEGTGRIRGQDVRHVALPAEDRMQAFAYRHLSPAQELVAMVTNSRRAGTPATIASPVPVRLVPGGTARIDVRVPGLPPTADVRLELDEPPPGLAVAGWEVVPGGVTVLLSADATAKPGTADNLIVDVVAGISTGRRYRAGSLPAIPVEVAGK